MGRVFKGRGRSGGQSLAEFALVFPIFIALVGGIVQFGMVFWAQNTLTQVVRDTGRYAATQITTPCDTGTAASGLQGYKDVGKQADLIAANAALWGHTAGEFSNPTNDTTTDAITGLFSAAGDASVASFTSTGATGAGAMAIAWVADSDPKNPPTYPNGEGCAPKDNQAVYHVTIKINQTVPTFFPGMQYLPGLGTCGANGCSIVLSSTAQFRMEPKP